MDDAAAASGGVTTGQDTAGQASLALLKSRAQLGVDAPLVTIEVFLSGGLPTMSIVGLAEAAVRESKDRVRGAILNSGFKFPQERIAVSLGPADLRKTGGRFDLAIALGILAAQRIVPQQTLDGFEFYGELGMNGELHSIPGTLPAALKAGEAGKSVFVPVENGLEATLSTARVFVAETLLDVTGHLRGTRIAAPLHRCVPRVAHSAAPDLSEVKGQGVARRALEIAAAGGHNILFSGPPGTGKSMLARRLPGILPPMSDSEALETAAIDSVLGRPFDLAQWRQRPFRAPHHTASAAALVGGGSDPRPGEISRAHNGVLFLDELPEFSRHVLEVLREPMESGMTTISRAHRQADFPARFQLVAAMNPCPCGYLGDILGNTLGNSLGKTRGGCRCSLDRVLNYRARISGPLLDRIDLQVLVQRLPAECLRPGAGVAESSAEVRTRVCAARERQQRRGGDCNARLKGDLVEEVCGLSKESWELLEEATERFSLSARAHQRVRRVARTIADLAGRDDIAVTDVAEALGLRQFDREPAQSQCT